MLLSYKTKARKKNGTLFFNVCRNERNQYTGNTAFISPQE